MYVFHALIDNFACFFIFIFSLQWSTLTFLLPPPLRSCNWDGDECREVWNWCCTRAVLLLASRLCPGCGQPLQPPVPTLQRETGHNAPTRGMEAGRLAAVRELPRNSWWPHSEGAAPPQGVLYL